MKKIFIIFLCMAAGLLSCTNDDNNMEESMPAGVPMTFNIAVDEGATTRANKTAWASGDKIYVFFKDLATKYLVLTYDGSAWSNTSGGGTLESTDFSGLGTKTLTAVYFPVAVDVAYADSKFSFTSGGKPVYNFYLFEAGKAYTVDGTTVTASLSMGKPANMVQIHVAGIQGSVRDYTFGCSKIKPVACTSVGTDGTITEDVLQAGARLSGFADSDGGIFAGRFISLDATDYVFSVASNDQIYTLTRTGKTLTAGKMYNFPSLTTTGGTNWAVQNASDLYVDLGLPSGTKWAKHNVGATTETGKGDYFAYGEIQPKSNYDWGTYLYGTASYSVIKYTDSGYTVLQPEDDVAYSTLGGKFRMPTNAELDELKNTSNCNWTWQSNYNGSGISGYLVTSKKEGYTSNSIFLPATGWMDGSTLKHTSNGSYRSSSLDTGYTYSAHYLIFKPDAGEWDNVGRFRDDGLSVRPVYAE